MCTREFGHRALGAACVAFAARRQAPARSNFQLPVGGRVPPGATRRHKSAPPTTFDRCSGITGAGRTIVIVDADILRATKYAVDHNLSDVISQSFGEAETCAPNLAEQHAVFAAATLKGTTLLASAGDKGVGR